MIEKISRQWPLALTMVALACAPLGSVAAPHEASYVYGVYYGERRIGEHEFVIRRSATGSATGSARGSATGSATGSAGGLEVRSEARMEFRVLFVPVYRYHHLATERWQQGCLLQLSSETDDNGTRYALQARSQSGALSIVQTAPQPAARELTSPSCPATFAYWDLDLLRREQLLNTQTGDLASVALSAEGDELLDGIPARRYLLQPEGLEPIRLWYRDSDDLWLRLETQRDGSTLSYRLERQRPSAQYADAS